MVAEAIGLGSRAESSPANRVHLCLRSPHHVKKLLRQSLRGVRLAKRADPALDTNFLRPVKWLVYFTGNFCLFPLAAAGPQA
jgi:hypothetical protein